jgi:hypothetical protein
MPLEKTVVKYVRRRIRNTQAGHLDCKHSKRHGENQMPKLASLAIAAIIVVSAAAAVLWQAAQIVA